MESKTDVCLLCLKNNYEEKSLVFFDLSTQEWENLTYLNKLQNILNAEILIYETTLICNVCLEDLNKAYEFKERVLRALGYWNVKLDESVNLEIKSGGLDALNVVNELNAYAGDITETEKIIIEETEEAESSEQEDDPEPTTFPCKKCGLIFPTASELIHHSCRTSPRKKRSVSIKPKPKRRIKKQKSDNFDCELCDLTFTKRWILNKHVKGHAVDKKFTCSFCDRSFKQLYHLREHVTTHTGERKYNCSICEKSFQRISSQRRHMRTHAALPGEKSKKSPFLCNICGKSFPYSNGAQRHMRIHSGDKRYECKVCGRKFSQSTHLRVHLRTHTGERPYRCNTCGEAFSIKASLHKHMKGHKEPKNDVKIFQNLEPNLSETGCREHGDEMRKSEFVIDDMYDQGYLITCNQ